MERKEIKKPVFRTDPRSVVRICLRDYIKERRSSGRELGVSKEAAFSEKGRIHQSFKMWKQKVEEGGLGKK